MKPPPEFTPYEWRLIAVALVSSKIVKRDHETTALGMAVKIATYTGQFDAEGKPNG